MRRLIVCMLSSLLPLGAQWFSVGVKGGVPLTNAFDTVANRNLSYISDTKRYLVGPAVELRFPLGLGAEFNALYKRLNYDVNGVDEANNPFHAAASASSWEFPLLFKLRAPGEAFRPYAVAGPNFRHLSDVQQTVVNVVRGRFETLRPSELNNRFAAGFSVGAGIEFGNRFRVAPEIRYTRWGWDNFSATSGFRSNLNQADFLLGIHF